MALPTSLIELSKLTPTEVFNILLENNLNIKGSLSQFIALANLCVEQNMFSPGDSIIVNSDLFKQEIRNRLLEPITIYRIISGAQLLIEFQNNEILSLKIQNRTATREVIDKIISDSPFLSAMTNTENMSLQELNNIFAKNKDFRGIILRIVDLYEGIYPDLNDHTKFLQLLNDLHYLNSSKELEFLVLLHFYEKKDEIVPLLPHDISVEYNDVKISQISKFIDKKLVPIDDIKLTIIDLELIDLLKTGKYTFTNSDFINAIMKESLSIVKDIWELGGIDLHYRKDSAFVFAVKTGNLDLIKYIWNLSLQDNVGKIDVSENVDDIFLSNIRNIEVIKYLWSIGLRPDVNLILSYPFVTEETKAWFRSVIS